MNAPCRIVAISLYLVTAFHPAVVGAQPAARAVVTAVRLAAEERITLDGLLTESVWSRAMAAANFRQQDPHNGEPASEPTEVRVVFDGERLIVGITCIDSQPTHLHGNQMQRDQSFSADDRFILTIDTYLDGRSGYYFEINPSGAMGDGLIVPGAGTSAGAIGINKSWDGIWNARVAHTSDGWTAEIEIPFHTVNFDPHASSWGINFQRTVRRIQEESLWSGYARNEGVTYMTAAGRLDGLQSLSQGVGLDVRPYAIGSAGAAPGRGDPRNTSKGSYGGDLFYNLTPGLRANLSINTDFAETEVDQRQVNLSRFALFFPEKRTFFLEGSSFFDFAREPGNAIVPFFSRRIGLDDDGIPQPVGYGAKLTGQSGPFDVGVLQVRTRDHGAVPGEDFTVLRSRRRFLQQSYIGGMYTRREGDGLPTRQTAGLDAVFATSHFLGRQVLEASGFYLNTTKRPGTRGGAAYGARLNYPNDPVTANVSLQEVQDGYDPAIGFVERAGYRRVNPTMRYNVRPKQSRWLRRLSFQADLDARTDLDGQLESRHMDFQFLRMILNSGDIFEFHLLPDHERLSRPFQIFRGVVLPAGGEYGFIRRRYQVQSADQRTLAVSLTYEDGPFYSGDRREVNGSVSMRPRRGYLFTLGTDYNEVTLTQGTFTTRVWRADVNTQFSPFLSLVNRVQYDSLSQSVGWQLRFRWITRPGDDVFVVYTQNWVDRESFETLDHRAAVKIVKTLRF